MLSNILTENITLDTPIMMLTPRQLFEMQREWMVDNVKPETVVQSAEPRYARNMKELAEALDTSVSTCYRMKASGILDAAISQFGRWSKIDIDKAIVLMRLSNRSRRRTKIKGNP